ncbi:MAG TPA: M20/M25/M40 family metallo-hydrolase [Gemmatimonadaceae bacterium]|nr:M20/M25/M40 family metallo-hydrolase [Gemmatimonadaceae bacterium]
MRTCMFFGVLVFGAVEARAQAPGGVAQRDVRVPVDTTVVARMVDEGMHRSHADADLEYLTDVVGPRLTGSAALRRANDWTQQKFREYGMDSTALEAWTFGVGWTRGPMTLRMLAPHQREMIGVSWAWSPGTNGPLAGDVVFMDARSEAEFNTRFKGKLAGKWVMMGLPYPNENPAAPPVTAGDSAQLNSRRLEIRPRNADEAQFFNTRTALVAYEHPAGLIRDGGKQFGLLTMSGSPSAISSLPQIVIAQENYDQFMRLTRRGVPVRIEADIHNGFTRETLKAYNTVAEIRGSERPGEVVLLGAHLDSWDLATGATDNGAGAIAVLEAARILRAAGVRPKRTIRFVLFSGEEEGLFGSQEYVSSHEKQMDSIQAVLVLDNGTGRITGMTLQGREELRAMWQAMLAPVASLGAPGLAVSSGNKTGTDHLSFLPRGVPAFNYDQATRGYNWTHHSQVDDYDNSVPSDIAQAATIMAVNAWQLADLDQLLPRGPRSR